MIDNVNLPTLNAEGKVKIELFDDLTGKKVEEIKTNNFIAKGVEYYFKILMLNQFTRNKAGGHSIEHTVNNMFSRMTLTDADHPENPDNEWLMKGKEIGWALTTGTYTGSDEKRGSYNTSESYTTQEQVHIVIDFPTHAANGTFQSIYFSHDNNISNFNIFRPFVNEGNEVTKVKKHNNEIWVVHGTTNGNTLSKYDLDFSLKETYNLPQSVVDFDIYNSYFYFVRFNTRNQNVIYRAPLSNPSNMSAVTGTTPPKDDGGDGYGAGICFDEKRNQFLVSSSSATSSVSGASQSAISRYDTNFNLLSTTKYTFPYGGAIYQKLHYDDGDIIASGRNNAYILADDDTASLNPQIGDVRGVIDDYKVMINGEVMPKTGISSRALLDTPVTKTSNVTMKITYDFMLPSLIPSLT